MFNDTPARTADRLLGVRKSVGDVRCQYFGEQLLSHSDKFHLFKNKFPYCRERENCRSMVTFPSTIVKFPSRLLPVTISTILDTTIYVKIISVLRSLKMTQVLSCSARASCYRTRLSWAHSPVISYQSRTVC